MVATTSPTVHTPSGLLRGVHHGSVLQFRGVPYAAPPLGALRWQPPVPFPAWAGTREATRHGPVCPQAPTRLRAAVGDFDDGPQSEDCLTVTVTTPGGDGGPHPVVVWLHGGGYTTGAGSWDRYDGAALAALGLVVVGVNHRLGPLGYWRHPGGGDGRAGLDDVAAALRWTHTHIGSFGGDPDRITVLGQSAGAHEALCLLATPAERDLMRRVVLLSAPAALTPLTPDHADEVDKEYSDLVRAGLGEGTDVLTAEAATLLRAGGALARGRARPTDVAPPFLPVDRHIGDDLVGAAARGAVEAGIDVVIGTARDEAASLLPDLDPGTAATVTDTVFTAPARRFADLVATAGRPVWTYRVDWAPTRRWGAAHCVELPLVFGTAAAWADAPMFDAPTPAAEDLGGRLRRALAAFATGGRPGPGWPRHRPGADPGAVLDLAWQGA